MEIPTIEKALRRVFWFALTGATVSSIYLEWIPIPGRIIFGGILGGLAGLAFSVSKEGATIGTWIGGTLGVAVFLLGFFIPGRSVVWIHLWVLPFYFFLGSSVGSIIGAIIGWTINALRRTSHDR